MALTTKTMGGEVKEPAIDPEYEIVTNEKGQKALKKIRNKVEEKAEVIEEKPKKKKRSKK